MAEERKIDFGSISFDDVLGDGIESTTVEEPQEPQVEEAEVEQEEPASTNELDADADRKDRGDEDLEDEEAAQQHEREDDRTVEDNLEEEGDDVTVASEISKVLGFEVENEYADTVEGLTEFVRDISQDVAENQIQELFEQFPLVQQHLDYVLAGGDSDKFFESHNPQLDYAQIQLRENDQGTQRAILAQYFQAKGHDNDFINEMLEDYEDSGKMFAKAEVAKNALANAQKAERDQLLARQQEQYEAQAKQQEEFWDGVAQTIESGNEFAGIRIPDRDKRSFFDYISAPTDDGRTQRDVDYAEAPMEVKLAIDYLMYSGFKLDDIIQTKARTESVKNLKSRIRNTEERVKNARKTQRSAGKKFDPDQLDINALF